MSAIRRELRSAPPATGTEIGKRLRAAVQSLPTDYKDYGGEVDRWQLPEPTYDCSDDCRWSQWLAGAQSADWCVCTRPRGPRRGLLTFHRQAGANCFQPKP